MNITESHRIIKFNHKSSGSSLFGSIGPSYYGEVLTIEPQHSAGDQDVVITGRAVDRATELPMANVPLKLVISVAGFERVNQVFTDVMGRFEYAFKPLADESGLYKVWAVHPDLTDRPDQGQFVISRVSVSPTSINLSVPRNYERTINIQVSTTEGAEVRNLRLLFEEEDQTEGVYPQGIHLATGDPITLLGSKQKANLPFTLWADNSADATGRIVLKVASDERILGDGEFVEGELRAAEEALEKRYALRSRGFDLEKTASRVAEVLGVKEEEVWAKGRQRRIVEARSLLCYWAVREVGVAMASLAGRLEISIPAVSKSVIRGQELAVVRGYSLLESY